MGKPLLLYNIAKLLSRKSIDRVLLPEGFTYAANAISASYPSLLIDEYKDRAFIPATEDLFELQLNSIIVESEMGSLVADQIEYPWDLLRIMNKVLESEVRTTSVSPNATVCESSIVSGHASLKTFRLISNLPCRKNVDKRSQMPSGQKSSKAVKYPPCNDYHDRY